MIFAWDAKNREHILTHDVTPDEAEFVVEHATAPFPQHLGDGKRRVWGATAVGRLLQVIYMLKKQSEVDYESLDPLDWSQLEKSSNTEVVRVIHAMDLTSDMKRQLNRRRR